MATYNYLTRDDGLLDKKITQGLLTSAIGQDKVTWLNGGRSFTITTISTSGLKPHTRGKGYNEGTANNDKKTYDMGQDRDIEFFVDKQDVDETNQDLAMANISKTFIEEHVQPELDAYRFSKLATTAITAKNTASVAIDETNAYSVIKAAIKPVRKYGPANITVYVSTDVMDALERSKEFTRNITNQNVGQTALESRITSIDGVTLIEVWDDTRFKTAYDFTDGFKAADDALAIQVLVVAKQAVIMAEKENAVYLFAPGEHTEGDGYLYQNRLYHDLWVLDNHIDGIYAVTAPAAGTDPEA